MLKRRHDALTGSDPCGMIQLHLFAACDGELAPGDARAINTHLAHCAPCRERFAADVSFHVMLRCAVALDEARPALRQRVQLALRECAAQRVSA